MIGVGIELGLLVGLPSINVVGGWRIVFGCALLPVHIMLLGLVRSWAICCLYEMAFLHTSAPQNRLHYLPFGCMKSKHAGYTLRLLCQHV